MTVTGGNVKSNFLRRILRHSYCVPDELFPYENHGVSVRSYRQLPFSGTKYNKFTRRKDELRYIIFRKQTIILINIYVGEQIERQTLGRRVGG